MRSIPLRLRVWLLVIGLIYAAYVLAGNIFLNTSIGRYVVNQKPERFRAQWSAALTLWPGELMVWNLDLHGHARTNLWMAHGDFAHGRIAILPLFHREFRMHSVTGSEVSIEADKASFDLPPSGDPRNAWIFRFDRIASTSLHKLRAGSAVLEGNGSMDFGFIKRVHGGPWQVLPSQVRMRDARFNYGQLELLRAATVGSDFAIATHTHAQAAGLQMLPLIDATLVVQGIAPGISLQSDALGKPAAVKAVGDGRVAVDLAIAKGSLRSGGRAVWNAPMRIADAKGVLQHDGRAIVTALVGDASIAIRAQLPPTAHGLGSLDANLQLDGRQPPLSDWKGLIARTSGAVDFDWHFTTLRWLEQVFSHAPWLRLDGDGQVAAVLKFDHGHLLSGSRFDAPLIDLQIQVLDNVFIGNGHAHGELVQAANGPRPHLHVIMDRFRVAPLRAIDRPYVRGRDLHLDLVSENALTEFRDSFQSALHFANAEVPDLTAYNRYLPGKSLHILGGNGHVGGDFELDADGIIRKGSLLLSTQHMECVVGGARIGGDLTLDGQLRKPDATGRRFVIDGTSIALSDLVLEDPDEPPAPPWKAHIEIERGRLQWKQPFLVDAHTSIDMQNIRLLIALFAKHREFPKWAVHLIGAGEVHAQGDLLLRNRQVVLDHIVASNNRFDLNARLQSIDGHTDGDLYLHWGLLGLGVALHDGQHKFHFVGAKKWYQSFPDFLPVPQVSSN